jgi:hypothetical protein
MLFLPLEEQGQQTTALRSVLHLKTLKNKQFWIKAGAPLGICAECQLLHGVPALQSK